LKDIFNIYIHDFHIRINVEIGLFIILLQFGASLTNMQLTRNGLNALFVNYYYR